MNRKFLKLNGCTLLPVLLPLLAYLLAGPASAQLMQARSAFTRADSLRGSLTTPLRTCYDLNYYHLDVKLDPAKRFISGTNLFPLHRHPGFYAPAVRPVCQSESGKGAVQRPGSALHPRG
jgi:hypothetical protein